MNSTALPELNFSRSMLSLAVMRAVASAIQSQPARTIRYVRMILFVGIHKRSVETI